MTAGLDVGAGPGSAALGAGAQMNGATSTLHNLLSSMAAGPNATPEVAQLSAYVDAGRR